MILVGNYEIWVIQVKKFDLIVNSIIKVISAVLLNRVSKIYLKARQGVFIELII